MQNNPFRGMFPRIRRRKQQQDEDHEADEVRMATRLHLDLGWFLIFPRILYNLSTENDNNSKKTKFDKSGGVDVFRGVTFSEWLRIFMTVSLYAVIPPLSYGGVQYCFNLTKQGQYELADEVLRHILLSPPYQPLEKQVVVRLALASTYTK